MARRIWLLAACTLLVAACGDDDDAAGATTPASSTTSPTISSVPVTTTSPTVAVATTAPPATTARITTTSTSTSTSTSVPTVRCAAPPAFDTASPLRQQFVSYLVACGFTESEGACLFDHLDFSDPSVVAGDSGAMLPAFRACKIDASRMAEIGGA